MVDCLLSKHGYLSSIHRNNLQKLGVVVHACNASAGESLASLDSQTSLNDKEHTCSFGFDQEAAGHIHFKTIS